MKSGYGTLSGLSVDGGEQVSKRRSPFLVPNLDGGGMARKTDRWTQMRRFLVTGSDRDAYYATARKLTQINVTALMECLADDPVRYIDTLVEMRSGGIVPKNDTVHFALALAFAKGSDLAKAYARTRSTEVLRTGENIESWLAMTTGTVVNGQRRNYMRGWGRSVRGMAEAWLTGRSLGSLVYQAVKYRSRNGVSMRNIVRLTHPHPGTNEALSAVYYWIANGEMKDGFDYAKNPDTEQIWGFELLKGLEHRGEASIDQASAIIERYRLPWEAVPTTMLNDPDVLATLVKDMPINATVRQLPRISRVGLFDSPEIRDIVLGKMTNPEVVKAQNVHPLKLLQAYLVYKEGIGSSGKNPWKPVPSVVHALEDAFYMSFGTLTPTLKNRLVALDVSGSMDGPQFSYWGRASGGRWNKNSRFGNCSGLAGISPREASAALAMITMRTEPWSFVGSFSGTFRQIDLHPEMTLDKVISTISDMPAGSTNIASAIEFAKANRLPVDLFEIYTDNESNTGKHPSVALRNYQDSMIATAKAAFVAMVGYNDSVADDRGYMMDFIGFDPTTPVMMNRFLLGSIG